MIFDLHCDTLSSLYKMKRNGEPFSLFESRLAIDEKKLALGNYTAQCFAAWASKNHENPYEACCGMIDIFHSEVGKSKLLAPVFACDDILKNKNEGKISAILSIEDCAPIGEDLKKFYRLYERGVRMMGLVWNYPNAAGYPNIDYGVPKTEKSHLVPNLYDGLTEFGRELVMEMNRLGVVIDVSHLSDAGFWEVAKISAKPFVASHSNARAVCSHVRNLTDGMLKKIAECGGVTGINYYSAFLDNDAERGKETVKCVIEHIKYIGALIGYDYIALGSDFDGIPKGTELDTAKDMPRLVDGLSAAGFSESVIEKITCENAMRVFRENLA